MSVTDPAPIDTWARPSPGDEIVRKLLRVPPRPTASDASAQRLFSVGMLISAARCLLSYVVFPVVTPLWGTAAGVGPAIGLPIAVLALYFDVRGIRRFWLADHRWRWPVTVVYLAVMGLVATLLVGDIGRLV
ncbi:MAG: hypothetical protein ACYDD4_04045 [Acidimicrobiales bacterium]